MEEDTSTDTSVEDHTNQNLPLLRCSQTTCYGSNENSLVCMNCDRSVHYKCSQLPPYQIQVFLNTKTKRNGRWTFCCSNCVEVHKELPALCQTVEDNFEELKNDIAERDGVIQALDDNEKKLIKTCKSLKTRNEKLKEKSIGRCTVEEMNEKIHEKITDLGVTMKAAIIEEIKATLLTVENHITEAKQSYAEVTKDPSNDESNCSIKEVIKEALREEEAAESDKQKRACNVIVHGVVEQDHNEDITWANTLINVTHSNVTIKRVTRLGKTSTNKKRPILVCLSNESEKLKLLGNLSALKGNDNFAGVSITEDLTPEERKRLRQLSDEAKEKNTIENSTTEKWRVRGNSKNGFRLMKLPLKKPVIRSILSPTKKQVSFPNKLTETQTINQERPSIEVAKK